ncbi:hypothetical protein ACFYW8_25505 [Streptomyces sp. NPDC002742]|uniref:hypothetical protein n=1 Tax=Streptomyces sp. NPDC002742 TaxID=3364663 RepID=UPI00368C6E6B
MSGPASVGEVPGVRVGDAVHGRLGVASDGLRSRHDADPPLVGAVRVEFLRHRAQFVHVPYAQDEFAHAGASGADTGTEAGTGTGTEADRERRIESVERAFDDPPRVRPMGDRTCRRWGGDPVHRCPRRAPAASGGRG